jgi:hypothetical protein
VNEDLDAGLIAYWVWVRREWVGDRGFDEYREYSGVVVDGRIGGFGGYEGNYWKNREVIGWVRVCAGEFTLFWGGVKGE